MKQFDLNQGAFASIPRRSRPKGPLGGVRMNVSRPYISKVLRSDVNISFGTAAKLARALEMDFLPELRAKGGVDKSC